MNPEKEDDEGLSVPPSMIDFSPLEDEIKDHLYDDEYSHTFNKCIKLLELDPKNDVANKTLEIVESRDEDLDSRLDSIFREGHGFIEEEEYEEALDKFLVLKNLFLVGNSVSTEFIDDEEYLKDPVTGAFAWSGFCRLQIDEPGKAVKEYNVVIDHAKRVPSHWVVNRGVARLMIGDLRKALIDLDKILDSDPKNKDALLNRGHVYLKMENKEKAKKDWMKAKKLGSSEAKQLLDNI